MGARNQWVLLGNSLTQPEKIHHSRNSDLSTNPASGGAVTRVYEVLSGTSPGQPAEEVTHLATLGSSSAPTKPVGIAVSRSGVFIADALGRVVRIDRVSHASTALELGETLYSIASDLGTDDVYVVGESYWRLIGGDFGQVNRQNLGPASHGYDPAWSFLHFTPYCVPDGVAVEPMWHPELEVPRVGVATVAPVATRSQHCDSTGFEPVLYLFDVVHQQCHLPPPLCFPSYLRLFAWNLSPNPACIVPLFPERDGGAVQLGGGEEVTLVLFVGRLGNIGGVAVDGRTGDIFLSSTAGHTVLGISGQTAHVAYGIAGKMAPLPTTCSWPACAEVSLPICDSATPAIDPVAASGSALNYPVGIAVTPSGNLVLADAGNRQVRTIYDETTCNHSFHMCPLGSTLPSGCVADTDVDHCGPTCETCRKDSNANTTCEDNACVFTCNAGYHECPGGCVSNDDPDHCGPSSCDPCVPPANADATCDGTSCGFTCQAGFDKCGGWCAPTGSGFHECSGVCVSPEDPSRCGLTCVPCPDVPNGSPTCSAGTCGIECDYGFHDCGGQCASNLSVATCGESSCSSCPTITDGSPTCDGFNCGFACNSGYRLCPVGTSNAGQCHQDCDADGWSDVGDNCPDVPNPGQDKTFPRKYDSCFQAGDACCDDDDGDRVPDDPDNCDTTFNPEQKNTRRSLGLTGGLSGMCGEDPGDACCPDDDGDGILDNGDGDLSWYTPCDPGETSGCDDNCVFVPNAGQDNLDGDNFGDACDWDIDGDGRCDKADVAPILCLGRATDNCPRDQNEDQVDSDDDGLGDACDLDNDDDGVPDDGDDSGSVYDNPCNPLQGIVVLCDDNCRYTPNADQADADEDGQGDACTTATGQVDTDGDGVPDHWTDDDAQWRPCESSFDVNCDDNCPGVANDQMDTDGDGQGDACDGDLDGDRWCNPGPPTWDCIGTDNCPLVADDQRDTDLNGRGDACDDSDLDGIVDADDNCPFRANPSQVDLCHLVTGELDSDDDGIPDDGDHAGDNGEHDGEAWSHPCLPGQITDCDDNCPFDPNPAQADSDGDGVGDACDNCPSLPNAGQLDSDHDDVGDLCPRSPADDLDGDGIRDSAEWMYGTDPTKWDTDGDGTSDGEEIVRRRNPLHADAVGGPPGPLNGAPPGPTPLAEPKVKLWAAHFELKAKFEWSDSTTGKVNGGFNLDISGAYRWSGGQWVFVPQWRDGNVGEYSEFNGSGLNDQLHATPTQKVTLTLTKSDIKLSETPTDVISSHSDTVTTAAGDVVFCFGMLDTIDDAKLRVLFEPSGTTFNKAAALLSGISHIRGKRTIACGGVPGKEAFIIPASFLHAEQTFGLPFPFEVSDAHDLKPGFGKKLDITGTVTFVPVGIGFPRGNPKSKVTAEIDQSEFSFGHDYTELGTSSESKGKLGIKLEACPEPSFYMPLPSLMEKDREWLSTRLYWSLDPEPGWATVHWAPSTWGYTPKVTVDALPPKLASFGDRTFRIELRDLDHPDDPGIVAEEQPVELFYEKTFTDHPTASGQAATPNWYFYRNQQRPKPTDPPNCPTREVYVQTCSNSLGLSYCAPGIIVIDPPPVQNFQVTVAICGRSERLTNHGFQSTKLHEYLHRAHFCTAACDPELPDVDGVWLNGPWTTTLDSEGDELRDAWEQDSRRPQHPQPLFRVGFNDMPQPFNNYSHAVCVNPLQGAFCARQNDIDIDCAADWAADTRPGADDRGCQFRAGTSQTCPPLSPTAY